MPFGKVSQYRQLEHFALKRFHHENNPQQHSREPNDDIHQCDHQGPQNRNEENDKSGKPEHRTQHNDCAAKQQGLDRMESHKTILPVRVHEQKQHRGHKREISKRTGKVYGKRSNFAFNSGFGPHRSAATRTETGIGRHLGGALRARHFSQRHRGTISKPQPESQMEVRLLWTRRVILPSAIFADAIYLERVAGGEIVVFLANFLLKLAHFP